MSVEKKYTNQFKHKRLVFSKEKEPDFLAMKRTWYASGRKVRSIDIMEYESEVVIDIAYYEETK